MLGSAPWRRAPALLVRHPASLLAVVGAAAVLGAVASGQSQYLASAASGALTNQLVQRCNYTEGASIVGGLPADEAARQTRTFDQRAAADLRASGAPARSLGPSVTTLALDGVMATTAPLTKGPGPVPAASEVTVYDRDGALRHVRVESRAAGGGDGVWLTDSTASQLGVRAGQPVYLGGVLKVPVAGVYANLQNYPRPLPSFWCSQETGESGYIGPPDASFPPPPLALVDRRLLLKIATALSPGLVDYQWQRPAVATGLTVDQGRAVVGALARMQAQQPAEGYLNRRGPLQMLASDLTFVVQRSKAISDAVAHSVEPVTVAGLLIALLLMASAASYWVDRRRQELLLLRSRGIGPAWLALKAVLEMGPGAVLGTAVGVGAARALVALLGPSPVISAASVGAGSVAAGVALAAGLLLIAALSAGRVRSPADAVGSTAGGIGGPAAPGRRPRTWVRRTPIELVVLAAAAVAWWRLSGTNPDLAPAGSSVASVGPLYLAFPALFVAGAAIFTARAGTWVLPWARRRAGARPGSSVFLGSARLAAGAGLAASLLAAAAMAVGTLVFAAAVTVTQQGTVAAKAETFVGSQTAVFLTAPASISASIRSASTTIERLGQAFLNGENVDVIGIDPATFARGAYWSRSYGAGSLQDAVDRLQRAGRGDGAVPVIVANGSVPATAQLRVPVAASGLPATRTLRVVEEVRGFTGVNGANTLVITQASALSGLNAMSEVLSRDSAATVLGALSRDGVTASAVVSARDVLDLSQFLSVTWSFAYLQALGVLIGLIVVAGVLLYIETRQRQRVAAYVVARRMGLSRLAHMGAVAVELGAPLIAGALVGMALGMIGAALISGHLDPLPDLNPGPELAWPSVVLVSSATLTGLLWWLATAWSQRGADRSSAAVVLRGEL